MGIGEVIMMEPHIEIIGGSIDDDDDHIPEEI